MKKTALFYLLFLLTITINAQVTISSGRLNITVLDVGNGVEVTSLKDNVTETLNTAVNPSVFTLFIENYVTGTSETIAANTGWANVNITSNAASATIVLNDPSNANLSDSLTATISILTNGSKSSWDLSVTGLGPDCSLMDAIFPELNIQANGNDTFLYPLYSGRLTENPGSGIDYFNDPGDGTDNGVGIYTRGWGTTMQFFSYYNATYGMYFGFHDPDASLKEFGIKNENGGVKILCKTPAANKTVRGNDWDNPGVFQLDLYDGDWFDAALIYKEWVSTASNYWPANTAARTARQHSIGDLSVWLTTSDFLFATVPNVESYIQTAISFFDTPVGVSIYSWNGLPMDHYFPNYFPELPGVDNLITNLQTNNPDAVIMPYINGRIWDTGVGGNDTGDVAAAAYYNASGINSATKRSNGSVYTSTFVQNVHATMCPTQAAWQDVLVDASAQITGPTRMNSGAVYIDMVCASSAMQCMDPTHGHALGGGSFWRAGYKQMFGKIHDTLPTNSFVTVEGGCDFLLDEVDGFMVQGWQTDHQVPAWQAIYTGKVQLFGTRTGGNDYPRQEFYGRLAQSFSYGVQTGRQFIWLAINPAANPEKLMAATFVKRLARMRYKLRNYMSYGEMKRPIEPEATPVGATIPTMTYDVVDWGGHRGTVAVTNSAIQRTVWKNANEVVVLFVNGRIQSPAGTAGGAINFKFDFNGADYGLTGDLDVQELTETSNGSVVVKSNIFTQNVSLQNLEVVAYKITSTTALSLEKNKAPEIKIYPNPAQSVFYIKADQEILNLEIFNSLGQRVLDINQPKHKIDVSKLDAGFYMLSFKTKNGVFVKKLLLE